MTTVSISGRKKGIKYVLPTRGDKVSLLGFIASCKKFFIDCK